MKLLSSLIPTGALRGSTPFLHCITHNIKNIRQSEPPYNFVLAVFCRHEQGMVVSDDGNSGQLSSSLEFRRAREVYNER